MTQIKPIDACRLDLFTAEAELREKYTEAIVVRVLRIREEYNWFIGNPDSKDRQFIESAMSRHGINKTQAYSDLAIIKQLLPMLSSSSRDWHRWKANQMLLETYQMAKKRKDTKTMERAAASYAKYNRVDLEDEQVLPYDQIVVQPFTATQDPTVLGIKPLDHLDDRIKELIAKYRRESMDIEDVEAEDVDLEEKELWHGESEEADLLQ